MTLIVRAERVNQANADSAWWPLLLFVGKIDEIRMMAALICVVSLAALVQVFVSYCRSVLASAKRVELSARVLDVADMSGKNLTADDFDRVVQLVRLCPDHDADRTGIRAIAVYYRLLPVVDGLLGAIISGLPAWTEHEREACSHFAAVVLERCISSSRSLFTQQARDRL